MKTTIGLVTLGAALMLGATQANAEKYEDVEMMKLANQSGCVACHSIASGGKGPDGLKPIGPAWQDVADKYKGDEKAVDALTATVLHGSSPYESHWKGKVSGLSMPPNAVAIKEDDAKKLVSWILNLAN